MRKFYIQFNKISLHLVTLLPVLIFVFIFTFDFARCKAEYIFFQAMAIFGLWFKTVSQTYDLLDKEDNNEQQ